MIRTYLAVATMILYIIINTIIFLPLLILLDEKNGVKLTKFVKRNYGRFVIWLIGGKVEIFYEDEEEFSQISKSEPLVVVANHQSFVDIPLIFGFLDMNVGFVAKNEIRKWLIFNLWMDRAQCIFLDRRSPRKALESFNNAIKLIRGGKSVCIFPEGTRSLTGEIGEFKKGSFKLALEPKVKILPVTIKGTYDAMNKKRFYINRGKTIKLFIGKIIDVPRLDRDELHEINNKVREVIVSKLECWETLFFYL